MQIQKKELYIMEQLSQRAERGAVLITGASTGIGRACALRLDREGFRVFAGVRRMEDARALSRKASPGLVPLMLDVTDQPSIDAACVTIASLVRDAGLAGLVNNAGIAVAGPLEFLPLTELRKQFEVNTTGQIAVTQAFLPLIRKGRGSIVNIGSISGRIAFPLLGPYCASKFALEALTSALRMELAPWGIHVAIVEPAGIATPIWRKALSEGNRLAGAMPVEAFDLYGPVIEGQRGRAEQSDRSGLHPKFVVRAVVHALTSNRPKTRYIIGQRAILGEFLRLLPETLRGKLILRQLK